MCKNPKEYKDALVTIGGNLATAGTLSIVALKQLEMLNIALNQMRLERCGEEDYKKLCTSGQEMVDEIVMNVMQLPEQVAAAVSKLPEFKRDSAIKENGANND